jgi:hypothetical protein
MFLRRSIISCLAFTVALIAVEAYAAVAVIGNSLPYEMRFTASVGGDKEHPAKPKSYSVAASDLAVIQISRGQVGSLSVDGRVFEFIPDTAYFLREVAGRVELTPIPLSTALPPAQEPVIAAKVVLDPSNIGPARLRSPTITVKIFVDEEEPTRQAVWSRRLRLRIAEASEILQKHCGIGLEVIDTGIWQSDNSNNDFNIAVGEFVKEANPGKAQLAIGFTSQYQTPRGRTHVGGTQGPLQRHIMLREWSKHLTESEKLEVLVHELGHYLGAVHSPERNSAMRPVPADRQSRAKKFVIHFDPLNALAMNLVAEEVRDRGVKQFEELSLSTKLKLRAIYTDIVPAFPDDPTASIYIQRLGILPQATK